MAVPDETELITPDSDIQQIYMQIMTLVYHKVRILFHPLTSTSFAFGFNGHWCRLRYYFVKSKASWIHLQCNPYRDSSEQSRKVSWTLLWKNGSLTYMRSFQHPFPLKSLELSRAGLTRWTLLIGRITLPILSFLNSINHDKLILALDFKPISVFIQLY